jgi:hypothetical protein
VRAFSSTEYKTCQEYNHWTITDRIASTCDCYTYKYTNKINELNNTL